MNTKLHKKLNPYLYPFKMKHDVLGFSQTLATLNKSTMNHIQLDANNEWLLPTNNKTEKKIFMVSSNSDTCIPLIIVKAKAITNGSPKPTIIPSKRHPELKPHSKTLEEPKSSEALAIPKINTVTLSGPHPSNLSCARPNPRYMVFEGSKSAHIFGRPVPEDVSWTRIDRAQKKLEMIPTRLKVAMGVVSGMVATTAVHPLDVIKVRLQLFPKKVTTMKMLHRIMVCEGTRGLYAGLTAGLLRQLTYTGSRLYVYNALYDQFKKDHAKVPDFSERLRIAIIAGLVGAFMGTPSEIGLVRMIEIGRLRRSRCSPPCSVSCKYVQRPEGVISQLVRIARREGVATWWRGAVPTLIRSIFVTTTQVGVYSEVRKAFTRGEHMETGIKLHLHTAIISSLFSAFLSLPVDQVKTRYQSYQERHRRSIDILTGMLRQKGVLYLWKGFLPYYIRQVIHTVISYVVLDALVDEYVDFTEATQPKR